MMRGPDYAWSSLEYGSNNWNLKYNAVFFDNLLVEARVAQTKNKFNQGLDPSVQSGFQVSNSSIPGAFVNPGPGFYANSYEKNRQYDVKVTKTFGDLELKAGYATEKLEYSSGNFYQGPPGFADPHPGGGNWTSGAQIQQRFYMIDPALVDTTGHTTAANVGTYYRVVRARTTPSPVSTEAPWEAYFIQGKYSYDNRLFIKAGFRWEGEDLKGRNIIYKFQPVDAMAPRISITWDPEGNGKNKIYAFYGKYFEKVPLDLCVRELSTEVTTTRSDFYNISSAYNSLSNPILTGTSIREVNPLTLLAGSTNTNHFISSGGLPTEILPGTKLPYTNEYVVGWDSQVTEKIKVSNRVVHRTIGRVLEDIGIDGGNKLPYYLGNPGQNTAQLAAMALAIDPTLGHSVTPTATWPAPVRDYWAYEFEANYNSAHWAGFFNLRLARLEGNYEGLFRNDNGQSDPNITSYYDFSQEYMMKYETPGNPDYHPRGLTGNELFATGPLPNDRAVIVNAGLTHTWDNGFSTSALVKFQTGTPLNKLYGIIDYGNGGELAAGGRGSQGRTPNTLAVDWSGSYTWKIRSTQSVNFRADIFNLFNASKPTAYDQYYELSPDTLNINFMNTTAFQTARRVRLGVKYQF